MLSSRFEFIPDEPENFYLLKNISQNNGIFF